MEQHVRVRMMRGKSFDSRWRRLQVHESGVVRIVHGKKEATELGLGGWIKGPKNRSRST